MGLELAGAGAAVVDREGKLRAYNHTFEDALGSVMIERRGAVIFNQPFLQKILSSFLVEGSKQNVASVGVKTAEDAPAIVVHLIPLKGRARDICGSEGVFLLTAQSGNEALPNADLLRLLFDLTPAESRVARHVAQGMTLAQSAVSLGVSEMTVRTQLRSVFGKTGVRRQAELVRLLLSIRPPTATPD